MILWQVLFLFGIILLVWAMAQWQRPAVWIVIILLGLSIITLITILSTVSVISGLFDVALLSVMLFLGWVIVRQYVKEDSTIQELTHYKEKLKNLRHTKNTFLRLTTHQLQGPVNTLRQYGEMLLDSDTRASRSDQDQIYINTILLNVHFLQTVIEDISIANQILNNQFSLNHTQQIELIPLVKDIFERYQSMMQDNAKSLNHHNISDYSNENQIVQGDLHYLDVALTKIILNSVLYSKSRIDVFIRSLPSSIEIVIRDDGIGFLPEEKSQLFTQFFRGSEAQKYFPNGSGLGLYIAKKIFDDHRFTISLSSQGPNTGADVILKFPRNNT